jgi:hypothetical protein
MKTQLFLGDLIFSLIGGADIHLKGKGQGVGVEV